MSIRGNKFMELMTSSLLDSVHFGVTVRRQDVVRSQSSRVRSLTKRGEERSIEYVQQSFSPLPRANKVSTYTF